MGWTIEDQQIWRDRKMKPHTIQYSRKTHERDSDLMIRMTKLINIPPEVKLVAIQFTR